METTPEPHLPFSSPTPSAATLHVPPVHVRGLTKKFRNGVVAVNGLDLKVEAGQVFGLLGLNGAGKTTTLRILLGLVRPSSGTVHIFGHPVTPGSSVLGRVGSVVDTPGFVPHLTGLQNLRTYWEAVGQDRRSQAIDDAVKMANLEGAIDREVRSYSFGMRQRLGIARALLGNPPLLILDEPTTGLDPKQVREVRSLIRILSQQGKTILLSSHLLGEVEQICSHAAVIHHGKLMASGSLADLTKAGTALYLEVDNISAAMTVLRSTVGVTDVRQESDGILLEVAERMERETIPRVLVAANIGIRAILPRRRLEDAFLGMIEEQDV
ncbi:MAG: ABC transporter ATP-binding protein [Actinobacteria bacterium]|nr:ABC transporter ATP-binding protein [Actinomycetota bacterium]